MVHIKRPLPVFLFFILLGCSPTVRSESNVPIPTARPRLNFVEDTAPSESQILSKSVYEGWQDEPRGQLEDWEDLEGYRSDVCLKVRTGLLAQNGDDFSDDSTFEKRVKLFVDDLESEHLRAFSTSIELINVGDKDGNVLIRGVMPRAICGRYDLKPGVHEVLFQFRQTSGDILEYRWQFELTKG